MPGSHRIAQTQDLVNDPFYAEIIEVETEISKLRSTSKNLANYIPFLRVVEPVLVALGLKKSDQHSAEIGQRRNAYNEELLRRLQESIADDTDTPCIQGNVLRDPESVSLSRNELLSISLGMMAVGITTSALGDPKYSQLCRGQTAPRQPLPGPSSSSRIGLKFNNMPTMRYNVLDF